MLALIVRKRCIYCVCVCSACGLLCRRRLSCVVLLFLCACALSFVSCWAQAALEMMHSYRGVSVEEDRVEFTQHLRQYDALIDTWYAANDTYDLGRRCSLTLLSPLFTWRYWPLETLLDSVFQNVFAVGRVPDLLPPCSQFRGNPGYCALWIILSLDKLLLLLYE